MSKKQIRFYLSSFFEEENYIFVALTISYAPFEKIFILYIF